MCPLYYLINLINLNFGLVFKKHDSEDKYKIYIQDSTETTEEGGEVYGRYKEAINKIYNGEYEIVKTIKQKNHAEQMFVNPGNAYGIQNQCRYCAIIFSEIVLCKVQNHLLLNALTLKFQNYYKVRRTRSMV